MSEPTSQSAILLRGHGGTRLFSLTRRPGPIGGGPPPAAEPRACSLIGGPQARMLLCSAMDSGACGGEDARDAGGNPQTGGPPPTPRPEVEKRARGRRRPPAVVVRAGTGSAAGRSGESTTSHPPVAEEALAGSKSRAREVTTGAEAQNATQRARCSGSGEESSASAHEIASTPGGMRPRSSSLE